MKHYLKNLLNGNMKKICEAREISAYQMEINRKNHQLKTKDIIKFPKVSGMKVNI